MKKILLSKSDIERFKIKFIKKSFHKCWNWKGSISTWGYGKIFINEKDMLAHRIAYFLHYKIDPFPKLVCHHCDNPKCVNPKHLFLGTHQDNKTDSVKKKRHATGNRCGTRLHPESITCRGDNHWTRKYPEKVGRGNTSGPHNHPERMARGERHGHAKLTSQQIITIRKQYASGKFIQKQLAKIHKISSTHICLIVTRKIWKHI